MLSKKVNYILKYFCQSTLWLWPHQLSLSLSQFLSLVSEISSHEQTLQRHDTKCHFHFECVSFLLCSESPVCSISSLGQFKFVSSGFRYWSSSVATAHRGQIIVSWFHVFFWGCDHLYKAGRHMRRCLQTFKRVLLREVLKRDAVQTFTRLIWC